MHINRKKLTVFAMSTMVAGVLVGPQVGTAAAKKTYKVSWTLTANKPGSLTDISGKLSGKPLGKGTQTKQSTLKLPDSSWYWKYKGGTLRATGVGTIKGATATGTWKITKGKSIGKFKGATGKGTFTVDLVTGTSKFKGKITY
jgi:hypothetical protein